MAEEAKKPLNAFEKFVTAIASVTKRELLELEKDEKSQDKDSGKNSANQRPKT